MTDLITEIPSPQHLRATYQRSRRRTPAGPELLPGRYVEIAKSNPEMADAQRAVLHELKNEFLYGNPSPESRAAMVEVAYRTARNMGDSVIANRSQLAFGLVDGSRSLGNRRVQFGENTQNDRSGHVRVRDDEDEALHHTEFVADVTEIKPGSQGFNDIKSRLEESGQSVGDDVLSFVAFMHTVAHEGGHMLQHDVGAMLKNPSVHTMSEAVVKDNQIGLGDDLQGSAAIHTERFAEGYGFLVTGEIATLMGLEASQIEAINRALSIDMVHPTNTKVEALGYTRPLSEEQIIADLEHVAGKTDYFEDYERTVDFGKSYEEAEPLQRGTIDKKRRTLGGGVLQKLHKVIRRAS